jgi:hypothetical protein
MDIGQPKRIIEIEPDSIPLPDTVVPFPEPMPAAEPVGENGREP